MLSHMARVPIPCPFKGCSVPTFTRTSALADHLEDNHRELLNQTIGLPSELLLPSWRPIYPGPHLLPPPTLPENIASGAASLGETSCAPMSRRLRTPEPTPSAPTRTMLLTNTPSRRRTLMPSASIMSIETDTETLVIADIPPFPKYPPSPTIEDFLVWRRPASAYKDVSRPQPMREPVPSEPPPASILYDVFRQRVEQLEADGLISFTDG